jgi:hypothetical protein
MSAWKQFEREAALLIDGKRFWANAGERLDVEGPWMIGQCKLVKTMSLNALTKLAEEMTGQNKIGAVFVKVRRGCGQVSAPLVVMTFSEFRRLMELWNGGKR